MTDINKIQSHLSTIDMLENSADLKAHNDIGKIANEIASVYSKQELKSLALAIDQSATSVIMTDSEGKINYVNQVVLMKTGYQLVELIGADFGALYNFESYEQSFQLIQEIIVSGSVWKGAIIATAKDGRKYSESATISAVIDNEGQLIGYYANCEDIINKYSTEATLDPNELKLKSLLKAIPDTIIALDNDGKFLEVINPTNSILLKMSEDMINGTIYDVFDPAIADLFNKSISSVLEKDIEIDFSFDIKSNGDNIFYEAKFVKCSDNRVLTLIRDVTLLRISEFKSKKQLLVKEILTRWASEFVNISLDKIDSKINNAIADIGMALGVDRVYLFSYDFEKGIAINTHEWCNDGISKEIENLKAVPLEYLKGWVEQHLEGKIILIENVATMPEDDFIRQTLESQGIQTLLAMPMINNGKCIGFVGYDSCTKLKKWSDEEVLMLKFLSELVYNLYDRIESYRKNELSTEAIKHLNVIKGILSKWASKFINVSIDNYDDAINEVLAEIGSVIDIDRIYVFKYDFINHIAINTHEWVKTGIIPQIDNFNIFPIENISSLLAVHKSGGTVMIEDSNDLDDSEDLKYVLQAQGTRSALGIPIFSNGNCLGFVGFDAVDRIVKWTDDEVMILKFLADMLYNLQDKLSSQKELEKSKIKAEENDKIKSAFLANISHEIRTPMTGIIGFAKLLDNIKTTTKEREAYLKIIIDSGNRLMELVGNVLDITMIESGQVEVFNAKIRVSQLIEELLDFYKLSAQNKNIELNLSPIGIDANVYIVSDYGKLHHILSNILDNAIKFTDKGSVTIACQKAGGEIEISIEDTGVGISEEFLPFLFNRFRQENINSNHSNKGTGLGLAIAKGLCDLIGARLSVDSQKNKGSKFTIKIFHNSLSFNNITKMRSKTVKLMDWKDSVVLIAEDDEINFKYIDKLLSRVSNVVTVRANNGKEAVEIALSRPEISLILMDIKMPVLDGHSAARMIKAQKPDLPIIAVTAFAMVQDKTAALKSGCDDYIAKPFEAEAILKIINKYLAK